MGDVGGKTNVDGGAARLRVRDEWARSADGYFLEAFRLQDSDPTAAVRALRASLEGWGYAACLELDPAFWGSLGMRQKPSLEDVLRRLGPYMDPRFLQTARLLQQRGNRFSHNQGRFEQATSREAAAALFDAAHLLEQLHRDVLRARPSPEVEQALAQVERPSRPSAQVAPPIVAQPRRPPSTVTLPLIIGAVGLVAGTVVTVVLLSSRAANNDQGETGEQSRSTASAATPSRTEQARLRLRSYLEAISTRDVDRIVNLHAIPTDRLFLGTKETLKKTLDETTLRALYNEQLAKSNSSIQSIDSCKLVSEAPIAFLCVDRTKECFVFDEGLKLSSRFDIQGNYKQPLTCPP